MPPPPSSITELFQNAVRLVVPPLLDFSTLDSSDKVKVRIRNTKHKFASDAKASGTDERKQPIFGSMVKVNHKRLFDTTFGLPFMRFKKGSRPVIRYNNRTQFTFNIHYHGLNTTGAIDGTSSEVI